MRIIVVSDSHKNFSALKKLFEENLSADCFIHLGDGERELEDIHILYPYMKILQVKGNCDYATLSDCEGIAQLGGKTIFYTHGHQYEVNRSEELLKKKAKSVGADIVLYGHTHVSRLSYEDGVYLFNPGSLTQPRDGKAPSYGVIDLHDGKIICHHVFL